MKFNRKKGLSILLSLVMLLGILPAMSNGTLAEEQVGVGSTWNFGEVVDLGVAETKISIIEDDESLYSDSGILNERDVTAIDDTFLIELNRYSSKYNQWRVFCREAEKPNGTVLWITVPEGKTSADIPTGIQIVSGAGTEEDPFRFGLAYDGTPITVTSDAIGTTWYIGDEVALGESYFYYDDSANKAIQMAPFTTGLNPKECYDEGNGQWEILILEEMDSLYLSAPEGRKSEDDVPTGFQILAGNGTIEHPFMFGPVYDVRPLAVGRSWDFGEAATPGEGEAVLISNDQEDGTGTVAAPFSFRLDKDLGYEAGENQWSVLYSENDSIRLTVPEGKTGLEEPTGVKVVGGSGTAEDPYRFALIYAPEGRLLSMRLDAHAQLDWILYFHIDNYAKLSNPYLSVTCDADEKLDEKEFTPRYDRELDAFWIKVPIQARLIAEPIRITFGDDNGTYALARSADGEKEMEVRQILDEYLTTLAQEDASFKDITETLRAFNAALLAKYPAENVQE